MVLFTADPSVLFALRLDSSSKDETANSLARILLFVSLVLAIYKNQPKYIILGFLGVVVLGISLGRKELFQRPSPIRKVHDKSVGNTKEDRMREYKESLLNNVRERRIYLGEEYGIPSVEEYMMGGTRPLNWDRSEDIDDALFGVNVGTPVMYQGVRARHTGAPGSASAS